MAQSRNDAAQTRIKGDKQSGGHSTAKPARGGPNTLHVKPGARAKDRQTPQEAAEPTPGHDVSGASQQKSEAPSKPSE